MNTSQYAIDLAREIIETKDTIKAEYFELRSKDTEFVQYKDNYIEIKAGKHTKALHVEIFSPLTCARCNPIIYVDDNGECFRNNSERTSFILYAELLLGKQRTMFFNNWAKEHENQIISLFPEKKQVEVDNMTFISEDKKTISLPVPLGTTLYRFLTSCNDACMIQREKFDRIFPVIKEGRCSSEMPCHTKFHSVQSFVLSLSNLDSVLNGWQINTFTTEDEAREAGEKLAEAHKQKLLELGLSIE